MYGQPVVPRWAALCEEGCTAPPRRFPSLFSTTSLGRSWHQFGSTLAPHDGALGGGALGGFEQEASWAVPTRSRRILENPFLAPILTDRKKGRFYLLNLGGRQSGAASASKTTARRHRRAAVAVRRHRRDHGRANRSRQRRPAQPEVKRSRIETRRLNNVAGRATGKRTSGKTWADWEEEALRAAVATHGTLNWEKVAEDVDSRQAGQCEAHYEYMKKVGRWDQITRETPLTKGILPLLSEKTVAKFAAHKVKTVGQLADIGPKGPWPCHEFEFGEFARAIFQPGNVTESKKTALAWKNKALKALKQK